MAWSRSSRHLRGYGTAWDKLRLSILARDQHLCRCDDCAQSGRFTPANEVDHIVAKAAGGSDDPSNLRAINRLCHQRKTLLERGATVREQTGLDGWAKSDR